MTITMLDRPALIQGGATRRQFLISQRYGTVDGGPATTAGQR